MITTSNLHPDDLLFFNDVCDVMRQVAQTYHLPLRDISPATMPESGMIDYKGRCWSNGAIEMVMRCTVDGVFCNAPRTPQSVWQTAAHELAHLKHTHHGITHQELQEELLQTIENLNANKDHRAKLIAKLVKMQQVRDGEAKLGNTEAAEAFASAINRMLIENELSASALDYARATDDDPVIEMRVDLARYNIEKKQSRVAWQESLAQIIAHAHLCQILIRSGSNTVWFVGTKSHAMVAEYVFGTLVPVVARMSYIEYRRFRQSIPRVGNSYSRPQTHGFVESWLTAFIERVGQRFHDARKAAVAVAPEGSSVALVRLNGALVKTRQYIDDKFKSRRGLSSLGRLSASNAEGASRGRAAADALHIGTKGVSTSTAKKMLT